VDTNDDCLLVDPGWNRKIRVSKMGSQSTVIWNPWIEKSARMPDFGDDEWKGMVCIETANVGNSRVRLAPGRSHITTAIISVE
jgi:D-hexose-6-phosphate mutarotase